MLTRQSFIYIYTLHSFKDGSILTIDEKDKLKSNFDGRRRYIYNQSKCLYGHTINSFSMKGRTCYVCNKCQIKVSNDDDGGKSGSSSSSNRSMMNTPLRPVKVFKSHCAPDKIDWNVPEKMTVKEIKKALLTLGQSTKGKKTDLCKRLKEASSLSSIQVGVEHIKHEMKSARYAAKNKKNAGEKRNIEHVALEDEASLKLYNKNGSTGTRRKIESKSGRRRKSKRVKRE